MPPSSGNRSPGDGQDCLLRGQEGKADPPPEPAQGHLLFLQGGRLPYREGAMPIDIEKLSLEELVDLNRRVVRTREIS
jgi:hypothetical protein